jgi:hypothetical protein
VTAAVSPEGAAKLPFDDCVPEPQPFRQNVMVGPLALIALKVWPVTVMRPPW